MEYAYSNDTIVEICCPPQGVTVGQLVGAARSHGWKTQRHETTSLRENTPLKADVIVYDREAAKIEAQKPRP